MTPALHLLHKPPGPTSFSLVQSAIDAARTENPHRRPRVCHGGTLDPFAQGLLILLAGPAVRLFDHLHAIPKTYETTVRWGVETDNGDPLGKPTFTGDVTAISEQKLDDALATFVGWHDQTPPATSNKRIDGERAYLKAHRGEAVELPPVRVYLHEAKWLAHDLPNQSTLRIVARGGYYVRALARDLGRLLGCGAHLAALTRTAIGPYADPGEGRHVEFHGRDLLPWAPARILTDMEVGDLRQKRPIPLGTILPPDWPLPSGFPDPAAPVRAYHQGRLSFLLQLKDDKLHLVTELPGGL